MSSIFQNARLIHIVGEVVILSAVVIYFHLQNQKLTNHIKEIVKKLEEQDELLKKHDVILQRLLTANVQSFQNPGRQFQEQPQPVRQQEPQPVRQQEPQPVRRQQPKTEIKIKKVETKPVALNLDTSIKEVEVEVEEDETENEEDLDEEIAKELEELEENDEIVVE